MTKKKLKRKVPKKRRGSGIHGDRVRKVREALGMTQMDLAVACETTPPVISQVEQGKRDMVTSSFKLVCQALDEDPAYLLGLSDASRHVT